MQPIKLSIPQPCHQNWEAMTPTQQGRFCNACAKKVVDFSNMSDTQVLHYFSTIKNENVCGRAYPDQLDRTITKLSEPKKKLFWYWNYITMLFLFFSKTNSAKAQGGIKVDTEIAKCKIVPAPLLPKGKVAINTNKIISGKVVDQKGEPVPGAPVLIKGSKNGTATDKNGFYKLNANVQKDVLEISTVGFVKQEIKLSVFNNFNVVLIKLEMLTLGEVVIVGGVSAEYTPPAEIKHVAIIQVIDNASLQPVKNAAVIITKQHSIPLNTAATDKKGIYKLKNIKKDENLSITIKADGFKPAQIDISGNDFNVRKIVKQVFLEKLPALSDYKNLDSVVVTSSPVVGKLISCTSSSTSIMGSMLTGITVKRTISDSVKLFTTSVTGTLKIAPNPVQKGNVFNLLLKIKNTGMYNIVIADAAGRQVMQKQFMANTKTPVEQIQVPQSWSSGIYYVKIFDSKNNFISTNSFSVQ